MSLLKKLSPLFALALIVGNLSIAKAAENTVALEDLTLIEENVAPTTVADNGFDHHHGHGHHHHGHGHHHHGHHHHGHHHHHSHWSGVSTTQAVTLPSPVLAM